ncbi:hypothetical protein KG112_16635 [Nocardioides sp. zg-ZUI104]|uniref:hypothetical protein n=1 Tax=Nocardioides faecalis TaxID=2803858 RepID=UPI001BD120AE|nr:hypothetical protein [Nocardioides faecalis]MBS4754436.1 hypothetical protein [Nocardioides faecalis]
MPDHNRRQPSGPWILLGLVASMVIVYTVVFLTVATGSLAHMLLQAVVAFFATVSLCLAVNEKDESERTRRDWLNIAFAWVSWVLVLALLLPVATESSTGVQDLVVVISVSLGVTAVFVVWDYDCFRLRTRMKRTRLGFFRYRKNRSERISREWNKNVGGTE